MISTRPMKYKLDFCYPNTYASFVQAVKSRGSLTRVGFLGIETLRLFVSVSAGKPHLEVYQKFEKSWEPYSKPLRLREPNVQRMCHSAQEFEDELVQVFFAAFPHAEESFYETLPPHEDVISHLEASPYLSTVEELMFPYFLDDDYVEEAEGVLVVSCCDGTVCVPYEAHNGDKRLQMYRAKFHPDSVALNIFTCFFNKVDNVVSRISSITFTDVLQKIDGLIK